MNTTDKEFIWLFLSKSPGKAIEIIHFLCIEHLDMQHHSLKGPWHEIFDLWFFHRPTSPGPLIHDLKSFSNIASKIFEKVGCTTVSMTKLCMSQRFQWHRCDQNWRFCFHFPCEFEAIFNKALTCASVTLEELFDDEKYRGRKSHVRVPLTYSGWYIFTLSPYYPALYYHLKLS
jgi:hypothetical protein